MKFNLRAVKLVLLVILVGIKQLNNDHGCLLKGRREVTKRALVTEVKYDIERRPQDRYRKRIVNWHKKCFIEKGHKDNNSVLYEDLEGKNSSSWRRWWWYKKHVNVKKTLTRRKGGFQKPGMGGGGNKKNKSTTNLRNLHFLWNGKLFKFVNVKSDGWCFYSSLCAAKHEIMNPRQLRGMLSKFTENDSSVKKSVHALFEAKLLASGQDCSNVDVKLAVEQYHKKVKSQKKSLLTWGDNDDALLYSLLTGTRVVTVQNIRSGFQVIQDSKEVLEHLKTMDTTSALDLPNWNTEDVSYIYYHQAGVPMEVLDGERNANHYAALLPVDGNQLQSSGWIFEGGLKEPKKEYKAASGRAKKLKRAVCNKRKYEDEDKSEKKKGRDCQMTDSKKTRMSKEKKEQREKKQKQTTLALELTDARITPEELNQKIKEHQLWREENKRQDIPYFEDTNRSILKAVIQFYLNSGCLRFGRWKDHSKKYNGQAVNLEELAEELKEETVSDEEARGIIQRFLEEYSWTDTKLYSCGCCGWREHESGSSTFVRYKLDDESCLSLVRFSEEEEEELRRMMDDPFYTVTVPVDSEWRRWKKTKTWEAMSYFEEKLEGGTKRYWHLHRELVEESSDGFSTMVCEKCSESLKENKIPNHCLKAGVDFGWYERLGLTFPNLSEQLILARNRLYYTAVKISSAKSSTREHNGRTLGRAHAILFPHNAPEVCNNIAQTKLFVPGGLLDDAQIRELLQIFFVTEEGEKDSLMEKVFGTAMLRPRGYVLAQWLLVLKRVNEKYRDLDVSTLQSRTIEARVSRIANGLREDAKTISDKEILEHEAQLGLDVGADEDPDTNGMQYTYVPLKDTSYLTETDKDFREDPLRKFARLDKLAEEDNSQDEMFPWTLGEFEEWLHGISSTESRRKDEPLNDLSGGDENLARAFPCVFLLGKAYGVCVPKMDLKIREHLLNQFSLVPARDKRMLGFLFNTLQRTRVMRGVSAFVDSNVSAVKTMRDLLNNRAERLKLQEAMDYPQLKTSKELLRKYMGVLRYVGRNVEYGALQGSKMKHRCIGLTNRYSQMNCFFTLSPNNLANPRSVRLACRTYDNKYFPAQFHSACKYGKNGAEFLQHMEKNGSNLVCEGTVELPEAFTRSHVLAMAKDNPVAFVSENKKILFQIMHLLVGLTPQGGGYRSKQCGDSQRRSRYYKESQKKGFLGHALTVIGVTEDHQRGHLHWHFVINAGVSAWVMERFCNIQEICDRISVILDQIYTTELKEEMHTAAAVTRTINEQKVEWDLEGELVEGVQGRDPMYVHPNKVEVMESWPKGRVCMSLLDTIQEHGGRRQIHRCNGVCFNNGWGYCGCRFNHPRGLCNGTHSSVLAARRWRKNDDQQPIPVPWWRNEDRGFSVTESTCDSDTAQPMTWSSMSERSGTISTDSNVGIDKKNNTKSGDCSFDGWNLRPPADASDLQYDVYDLRCHPLCGIEDRYHSIVDVLDNRLKKHVVHWETSRGRLELPDFLQHRENRSSFIEGLKQHLQAVPPFNNNHSKFWHWLEEQATDQQLETIRVNIEKGWETGNGNVSAFNPIVAFCTAAHHNVEFLGGMNQAKNAMFYLIPYQSKNKFPIKESFAIIHQSLKDVQSRKSKTPKEDGSTVDRKVKQALERIINKMQNRMELSEYQVVAALLELPSMITTDTFEMGNPSALVALRTVLEVHKDRKAFARDYLEAMELGRFYDGIEGSCDFKAPPDTDTRNIVEYDAYDMEDEFMAEDDSNSFEGLKAELQKLSEKDREVEKCDEDALFAAESDSNSSCLSGEENPVQETEEERAKWYMSEALKNHGHTRKIVLESAKVEKMAPPVIIVPQCLLYLCRGDALAWMNYYEYLGCIKFVPKQNPCLDVTNFKEAQKYELHPDFDGARDSYHHIKLKQTTPLLCGRIPRHPGPKPDETEKNDYKSKLRTWQVCADAYARHYLVLFRPETIEDRNLGYTWNDLEQFVNDLQEDDSFISKSRLIIMENHMRGLKVSNICDIMMKDYRSRARRIWTAAEQTKFRIAAELRKDKQQGSLWDKLNNCDGGKLSDKELKELTQQINHDKAVMKNLDGLLERAVPSQRRHKVDAACLSTVSAEDIFHKASDLRGWKSSGESRSTASDDKCPVNVFVQRQVDRLESRNKNAATQQVEFFRTYAEAFSKNGVPPPRMTLLHGPPGVGKSELRDTLIKTSSFLGNFNLKTAAFAINAIGMQGFTTASLICREGRQVDVDLATPFNPNVVADLKKQGLSVRSVVFVEEVSTQAPAYVARLSELCKEIINNGDQDFGGCHVIFIGDFTQLGPVLAGRGIPQAVFDVYGSPQLKKKLKHNPVPKSKIASDRERKMVGHPYRAGVDIFTNIHWFELNIQQRAITDAVHSKFVEDTYFGVPLHLSRIKDHISLLKDNDLLEDEWASAPVLVATNRQRYSITDSRARHLAKLRGTVVIRWLKDFRKWQNQPNQQHRHEALQDPCFYEYFVHGMNGFVTKNVSKDLHIVNGKKIVYESIRMDSEWQDWLLDRISRAAPGEVITLPEPPICINVRISLAESLSLEAKEAIKNCSLSSGTDHAVIPITPLVEEWPTEKDGKPRHRTPVYGGEGFGPSRVQVRNRFPLQPALAITVHKAQGDTLDRAIIAMSQSSTPKCNFSYEQVHVAFSRVREGRNLRLLLAGSNEAEQWSSITYVSTLHQDPTIAWYFMGFRERIRPGKGNPNQNWKNNEWSANRANQNYLFYLRGGDPWGLPDVP